MEDLEVIIQRMVEAGESEENIALVIENYNADKADQAEPAPEVPKEAVAEESGDSASPSAGTDSSLGYDKVDKPTDAEMQGVEDFITRENTVPDVDINKVTNPELDKERRDLEAVIASRPIMSNNSKEQARLDEINATFERVSAPKKSLRKINNERIDELSAQQDQLTGRAVELSKNSAVSFEDILKNDGVYQDIIKQKDKLKEFNKTDDTLLDRVKEDTNSSQDNFFGKIAKTFGLGDEEVTQTAKLNDEVEEQILLALEGDNRMKEKIAKGFATLDEKEGLIANAKFKVVENEHNSLIEQAKAAKDTITDEAVLDKELRNIDAKYSALLGEIGFDSATGVLNNSFRKTDSNEKFEEYVSQDGFFYETADAVSSLLEGVVQTAFKGTVGFTADMMAGFSDVGMSDDTYSVFDAFSDTVGAIGNYNLLPSSQADKTRIVDDKGNLNISYRTVTKSLAQTLPFTLAIINDAKRGKVTNIEVAMGKLLGGTKSAKMTNSLRLIDSAYRHTLSDNINQAESFGLSDNQARVFAHTMSIAEGMAEMIMPDTKFFSTEAGNALLQGFKGSLKSATTKKAGAQVVKNFMKNIALELGEEEVILATEDLMKYSMVVGHENSEFFDLKQQKELAAATVIMSGTLGGVNLKSDFRANKGEIYRKVSDNINEVTENLRNELGLGIHSAETKESITKTIEWANNMNKAIKLSPVNVTGGQIDLLMEKANLVTEMKSLDPAFHAQYKEKIDAIDAKINPLNKKTEEGVAKAEADIAKRKEEAAKKAGKEPTAKPEVKKKTKPTKTVEQIEVDRTAELEAQKDNLDETYGVNSKQTVGEQINAKYDKLVADRKREDLVPYKAEEVSETTDAKQFAEAQGTAMANRKANKKGDDLQVEVMTEKMAQKIVDDGGKLFMTSDGKSGAYVTKEGYMGGLFKDPNANRSEAAKVLQEARIKAGGNHFDAFGINTESGKGTDLEQTYIDLGFRPIARFDFDENLAPKGWEKTKLKEKPDNVIFVYDPKYKAKVGEGKRMSPDSFYEALSNAESFKKGNQNTEFFTNKAAQASSKVPYKPVLKVDKNTPVAKAYDTYSAGGNFTGHISKMIAGFAEKQIKVAEAIVKGKFKSFLDIGASEGGLVKTVASLGVKRAVGIDPNTQMKKNFESTPPVKNAELRQEAFLASWTEDDGTKVNEFKPKEKFEVVNEDFAFQFMNNDRKAQVEAVKGMMTSDGVFITSEKFHTANSESNEKKKYDHQKKYFNESDLTEDKQTIISGMASDMVNDVEYFQVLKDNFKFVEEFWNAGDFKGYLASDSKAKLDAMKKNIGDLSSEFTDKGSQTSVDNIAKDIDADLDAFMGVPKAESAKATESTRTKVQTLAERAKKALSRIAPNAKINIYNTTAEFEAATGKKVAGLWSPNKGKGGTISINLDYANERTVAHETVHAVLGTMIKSDKALERITDKFLAVLAKNVDGDVKVELDKFMNLYADNPDVKSEEFTAELGGMLADNYTKLSNKAQGIVKQWLDTIAKKLGLKEFTDSEIIDLLNKIADKTAKGEVITEADVAILSDGAVITGEIPSGIERKGKQSKFIDSLELERLPTHKNIIVKKRFNLRDIAGQVASSTLSDKLVAGRLGDFLLYGGVGYPEATGLLWAASNKTSADKITNKIKKSKDGFNYLMPAIMSNVSHMSNRDMTVVAIETLKEASKNGEIDLASLTASIEKAFSNKSLLKLQEGALNAIEGKTNINETLDALLDYIFTPKFTFVKRRNLLQSMIGDAPSQKPKYSTVGTFTKLAGSLAEPLVKDSEIYEVNVVYRTKGTLRTVKIAKTDPRYHKSYPYAVESSEKIEVLHLVEGYNLVDIFPEFTKADGDKKSLKQELEDKLGEYTEKYIRTNHGRTHGLSSYSAPIVADKPIRKDKSQRTDKASEKLVTLFDRDNVPLTIPEAKEMVNEVLDWADWYDGLSGYVNKVFGEYGSDVLSILPLASMGNGSAGTVTMAINNVEKIYKGERPSGLAEYYNFVTDFLEGKGIKSDKMYNFFKALLGDPNAVAVDMHVYSIIKWKDSNKKQVNPANKKEFAKAKEFVNTLAKELGMQPREVQASLWALNILRTGGKPDSYEQYIEKHIKEKNLYQRVEGWGEQGYKPFSEVREAKEAELADQRKEKSQKVGIGYFKSKPAANVRSGNAEFRKAVEAKREAKRLEREARKDKGQRLAPNGKPSNLDEVQHKVVRTPTFKKWFGDWENDAKNASKVVDENGEPMVVYHGTDRSFDVFDINKLGSSTGNQGWFGKGFYFTPDKVMANGYAGNSATKLDKLPLTKEEVKRYKEWQFGNRKEGFDYAPIIEKVQELRDEAPRSVFEVFLNIKSPQDAKIAEGVSEGEFKVDNKTDGAIITNKSDKDVYEIVVRNPNQIKLADGTNKTFSPKERSIKLQKEIEGSPAKSVEEVVQFSRDKGYEDTVIKDALLKRGFSKEQIETALATIIPTAIVKGAAKAVRDNKKSNLKADVDAVGIEHVKSTKWYRGLTVKQKDALNKKGISNILADKELALRKGSQPTKAGKKFRDTVKDVTGQTDTSAEVTMTKAKLLKEQIKTLVRGAKMGAKGLQDLKASFIKEISIELKSLTKSKIMTLTEARKVLAAVNQLNFKNYDKVSELVDKVIAEIENKGVRRAIKQVKTRLRKGAKSAKNPVNMRELAKEAVKVNEVYLTPAERVKYSDLLTEIQASFKLATSKTYRMANEADMLKALEVLNQKAEATRLKELATKLGLDGTGLTNSELVELVNSVDVDEYLGTLKKEKAREARIALEKQAEYARIALNDVDGDTLTEQEKKDVRTLKEANLELLTSTDIRDLIKIVDNIVTNQTFASSGNLVSKIRSYKASEKATEVYNKGNTKMIDKSVITDLKSLALVFKTVFQSTRAAALFDKMSGLTKLGITYTKHKKAMNALAKSYDELFAKLLKNHKRLNKPESTMFRGLVAQLIQGTTSEDFDINKSRLEDHINKIKSGAQKQSTRLGLEVLEEQYEALKGLKSQEEVIKYAKGLKDGNWELVEFWMNHFESNKEALKYNTEVVHGKSFEEVVGNYLPIKLKADGTATEDVDNLPFFDRNGLPATNPSVTTISRTKTKKLPPNRVLDLDFDSVMFNKAAGVSIDIETSAAYKDVYNFFHSPNMAKMFGTETIGVFQKKLTEMRKVQLGIASMDVNKDETIKVVNKVERIWKTIATTIGLGSITQYPKQYISVAFNAMAHLGNDSGLMFSAMFTDKSKIPLLDMVSVALRGETQAGTITGGTRISEAEKKATKAVVGRVVQETGLAAEKVREVLFYSLRKGDVNVAKSSWIAFYQKYLKDNNVTDVDMATEHERMDDDIRQEAIAYAELKVEETQISSDESRGSEFYQSKETSRAILRGIFLPYQSFNINSKMRMLTDMRILADKKADTVDRKDAGASLLGTAAEMITFQTMKYYVLAQVVGLGKAALESMFGLDAPDEDEEQKAKFTFKQWYSALAKDLNPLAIGSFAEDMVIETLNLMQFFSDADEDEAYIDYIKRQRDEGGMMFYRYKDKEERGKGFGASLLGGGGLYSIPYSQFSETMDAFELMTDKTRRDGWGNLYEYDFSDEQMVMLRFAFAAEFISMFGLGEADSRRLLRKMRKDAVKKGVTKKKKIN